MRRRIAIVVVLLLVAGGGYAAWRYLNPAADAKRLTLYGNIDVRQVDLAFKVAGRIEKLAVDEGDAVKQGQVMASLEKSYFDDDIRLEQARVGGLEATLLKLKNGSRPEEIAQARAGLAERKANQTNAQETYGRQSSLVRQEVTSRQNFDNAAMALRTAEAQVNSAQANLDLVLAGPRIEDIDAAQAALDAEKAQLLTMERKRTDADLMAPSDGIILTRAREAGAIVQPGETVFTLTLNSPVWVRAYVDERDLGRVRPGMAVAVHTDAGKSYKGTIGFISPLAEFTPKSVETPELRTDLVYRLRIIVGDADQGLRQGMPVTVVPEAAK